MIPGRYIPDYLKSKDKKKQKRELKKSRKRYKEKKYYTRKKIKSFKNKVSPHIKKAMRMYKVDKVSPTRSLAKATGCSIGALRQIVKKGQGAYFSSGSRPNQTAHSWGNARLASSITGGKAAAVDLHVLEKGCKKNSKALRLAKKSKKKYKKKGMKVTRKVSLKGGGKVKPRKSGGKIIFEDYPEFRPNLTPRQIFKMGSFGGTYWRPIKSKFYGNELRNKHKKFPWLADIPNNIMTKPFNEYDVNINKYKVKVGTTLEFWESKNWINKKDPYGWVQWYCNFYSGRRSSDDKRQIDRWLKLAGPKGRFRKWLITKIKNKERWNNESISPAMRQTLQHWAYRLTKKDLIDELEWRRKNKR
tara:strand:+ start:5239 stop:6315 length:1077 start_codon:yes stop_codon:yes gene_type:complete